LLFKTKPYKLYKAISIWTIVFANIVCGISCSSDSRFLKKAFNEHRITHSTEFVSKVGESEEDTLLLNLWSDQKNARLVYESEFVIKVSPLISSWDIDSTRIGIIHFSPRGIGAMAYLHLLRCEYQSTSFSVRSFKSAIQTEMKHYRLRNDEFRRYFDSIATQRTLHNYENIEIGSSLNLNIYSTPKSHPIPYKGFTFDGSEGKFNLSGTKLISAYVIYKSPFNIRTEKLDNVNSTEFKIKLTQVDTGQWYYGTRQIQPGDTISFYFANGRNKFN